MTQLRASDLEAVLSFLEEAQAVEGPAPLTPELLDRLATLARCEAAAFFEVDHPTRTLSERVACSWDRRPWNGIPDDVWTCARTVLLHRHMVASGPGPIVLAEVFNRRLRFQPDFNPNLREDGSVDEIHVDLDPPRQWKAQLVVFRSRDFEPRERLIMQLVRPHLAGIYRAAELRRRLSAVTATLDPDAMIELTPREREVMDCVADGLSNAEIASVLVVELSTVRKHLEHVYEKLGAQSRTAALAKLRRARELH
jgi:DNA-binding CsgD family transcriptional regulator